MAARASLPPLPDTTWAYLAGLVDGEGTISIHRRKYGAMKDRREYVAIVYIAQKNRMILDWVKETVGLGTINLLKTGPDPRDYVHSWVLQSNAAYLFVMAISPYLRIKREHARIIQAFQEAKREWTDQRQRVGRKGTVPTPNELVDRYQAWLEEVQGMNRHARPKLDAA